MSPQDPAAGPTLTVWVIYRQSDMTEGNGPMRMIPDVAYANEQDAWDAINDRPGVFGRHPSLDNCYPVPELRHAHNWQQAKAIVGYGIDYDVRPLTVVPATPDTTDGPPVVPSPPLGGPVVPRSPRNPSAGRAGDNHEPAGKP